ncbi:MAG: protein-L-isoaspartate(D-aspartate) O-methyltransferase [Flavobacteriaceae bacterium]
MEDSKKHQGLRRQLVNTLREKGISSESVLMTMLNTPRHWFMDQGLINFSYEDQAYPIAANQTISQPYTVAFQSQLLELIAGHKVLEIGTGSGYQTAILLGITSNVYTLERQKELFKKTQLLFNKLNLRPKRVIFGDGYKGLPDAAPFDRIIVTAGAPEVPQNLLQQLKIGGKLVIPVGQKQQQMMRFTRTSEKSFDKETFGTFQFVPLLGDKN